MPKVYFSASEQQAMCQCCEKEYNQLSNQGLYLYKESMI